MFYNLSNWQRRQITSLSAMTVNNMIHFNTYVTVCLPLVVDLRGNDHLVLLLSLQHLFTIDAITKAIDFVFLLIAEATGRWIFARDVDRLRVRSGEPMMTLGSRKKPHTWNEIQASRNVHRLNQTSQPSEVFILFCTVTNKWAINGKIITLLLHVSTLLCHPQGARS